MTRTLSSLLLMGWGSILSRDLHLESGPGNCQSDVSKDVSERWHAILQLEPENELALLQLASNAISQIDTAKAKMFLDRLSRLAKPPNAVRHYALKARYLVLLERPEEAIPIWKSAMAVGYDQASGHANIANNFLALRNPVSAKEHVELAKNFGCRDERIRIIQARCAMQEFDWDSAIAQLEDLDSFHRQRESAAKMLFHCYMNDNRNESASKLCQLLEADEKSSYLHLHGQLKFRENQYGQAMEKFTKAIALDGGIESKIWLIKTLTSVHDEAGAVAQIRLLQETSNATALIQGKCWEAAGMLKRAESFYLQAVTVSPNTSTYHSLARFYYTYRLWSQAYLVIRKARKRSLSSPVLDDMFIEIEKASKLRGRKKPTSFYAFGVSEFRSSEEMVSGIVDLILDKTEMVAQEVTYKKVQNVVLVIGSLGPGGAERQVVNLANGLSEERSVKSVNLLCTHLSRKDQDRFYESQVNKSVQVLEYYNKRIKLSASDIPELGCYADYLELIQPESRRQTLLHLAKCLVELKPDAVHGWLDETFINTSLVCGMLGIRNSIGRWGSMPAGVSRMVNERDLNNVDYLNHAYQQIARIPGIKYSSNSRLTANAYAELLGIDNDCVNIVYNGVNKEQLFAHIHQAAGLRSLYSIPADALVVGTIFRISEEKRPELWVDVAERLSLDFPDAHFVIVGTGPLESTVQKNIEKKALRNFHLVGKQENVGAWYELFDVLLLTSRVEGVSNVVVESQMCGCPVVAPNVGGLSEAILDGETGYLLDDQSVDVFATSVRIILQNTDLRKKLSGAAASFADEKFSVNKMVENYLDLFTQPCPVEGSKRHYNDIR